ncbi:MAG: metallophosphoesterase [Candidatus Nezhaarchaeota archaeon]|nr:metallophosphoesterase [Candidatus Nezhaarchaeota archaeon]MCX8142096.1 metallophosphoesterase [Candidatus Nezhaarchaeota archaeon]MDW8050123.1 metallophosphoesterase [Nitrososphaerota archaeon]
MWVLALILIILALSTMVYSFWDVPPITQKLPTTIHGINVKVVGLISDTHTHLPILGIKLPERVFEIFKEANVSLIIHAGDIVDLNVIRELERIAAVVAVYGNTDPPEIRALMPAMAIIEVNGKRVGVIHDVGVPPLWGTDKMERIASENNLDVLVFGHTHKPFLKIKGDVIFINPGSPINPLPPLFVKRTVGLLVITEDKIEPYIIEI